MGNISETSPCWKNPPLQVGSISAGGDDEDLLVKVKAGRDDLGVSIQTC